ncbi:response regulator transcription factor [Variovorax sp. YR216]|uniref:response regulator transcription factor n=1 Tax=Variovorax sp. YR216 TaxID=1882828 RepID=UPI000899F27E|nr:response regulator transcription factor [Variovorax sp. YR216]SEB11131.1 two component transcriptional regulator, LuxR family [Variovorax sp. YR216]
MHSVVVVDGHPAIRLAVRTALTGTHQFEVIGEAGDGPSALETIRELAPELVVLDLELPRLNGLDVIERVRKALPETKLIVLSGQEESIFGARAVKAGANAFISKSEDLQRLIHAAHAVLAGYSIFATSILASQSTLLDGSRPNALIRRLSDRELTVLQHLARGLSNKEIAEILLISNKTISGYKARIFEKLNISSLVELVDFSRTHRLVT